jgi:hypothetical protein
MVGEPVWLHKCSQLLAILQSCAHAAYQAGSSSSSSKDSTCGVGANSSAAAINVVQLSSYTEPCAQPFLQLSGLILTVAQSLAVMQEL